MTLEGFETPFEREMDKNNRRVKLGECIPWDTLTEAYYQSFTTKMGRPAKDSRLIVGAVIIKHKLKLSDKETVFLIQENPYLQYFYGLPGFQIEPPFAPSLFVEIRRRMGAAVFEQFHQAIIDQMEGRSGQGDDREPSSSNDARSAASIEPETESDQSCDITSDSQDLLNESREINERLIDALYPHSGLPGKPRTYRQKARQVYLDVVKQRRSSGKRLRRGIKHPLQYLRRHLGSIETLLDSLPGQAIPLTYPQLKQYWVIQHVTAQQAEMYHNKDRRCDDRILSLHRPHVRPIVRGKVNQAVEFGAKPSVSLTGSGLTSVDRIRWDAFHEGADLKHQVETYKARHGVYPESVHAIRSMAPGKTEHF